MPQMAPISWLILFFIFSISIMIYNILNYYCFSKNKVSSNNNNINNNLNNYYLKSSTNLIWKW